MAVSFAPLCFARKRLRRRTKQTRRLVVKCVSGIILCWCANNYDNFYISSDSSINREGPERKKHSTRWWRNKQFNVKEERLESALHFSPGRLLAEEILEEEKYPLVMIMNKNNKICEGTRTQSSFIIGKHLRCSSSVPACGALPLAIRRRNCTRGSSKNNKRIQESASQENRAFMPQTIYK